MILSESPLLLLLLLLLRVDVTEIKAIPHCIR